MHAAPPHSSCTSADVGSAGVRHMQVGRHLLLIRQQLSEAVGSSSSVGRRAAPTTAYGCEVEMEDEESRAAAQEAERRAAAGAARGALAESRRLVEQTVAARGLLTVCTTPAAVGAGQSSEHCCHKETADNVERVMSPSNGTAATLLITTTAVSAAAVFTYSTQAVSPAVTATITADAPASTHSHCSVAVTNVSTPAAASTAATAAATTTSAAAGIAAAGTAAAGTAAAAAACSPDTVRPSLEGQTCSRSSIPHCAAMARSSPSSLYAKRTVDSQSSGTAQSALADVGLMVWQSGFVLAELLLHNPPFGGWGDVSCVDLGTGTGIVGIALALEGCRKSILTDLQHITSLTQLNVNSNCDSCHSEQYPTVLPYPWGAPADDVISANGGSCPDLITGADIIFDPQYHNDLLETLMLLSAPHTITYLAHRLRHAGEEGFVEKAFARGFSVEIVPDSQLHEDYSHGDYQVLRLCRQDVMEE